MRKTKEYSSDVKNKIVELHKIESGCKKRAKALKIPISTIRTIIEMFQSTKDVTNLPGRWCVSISSQCTVRRRVWVAKDSPRITAGELQRLVESWDQKAYKKISNKPLYHHMLFGRVSRKIILAHPKTKSSMFSCQTRLELQMAQASMVRWNWKKSFLAANPPDEFSTNRDKKYPMPTVKYTAGSLMLWACFSAGGPGYFVQMNGIMDSIKYQQIKNSKPDCLCKKSYHGPWLDLQSGQ